MAEGAATQIELRCRACFALQLQHVEPFSAFWFVCPKCKTKSESNGVDDVRIVRLRGKLVMTTRR